MKECNTVYEVMERASVGGEVEGRNSISQILLCLYWMDVSSMSPGAALECVCQGSNSRRAL